MTTETTWLSECCGASIAAGRCSSCLEGCVGEEHTVVDGNYVPVPKKTTYGQDMDTFRKQYHLSELAWAELQLIVLKAARSSVEEFYKSISKDFSK